ncbi:FAM72 family protein [Pleurotus pulmonarius]|nr:hypothetical protein EYR36_003842 [Pleurotus pulmonarius]
MNALYNGPQPTVHSFSPPPSTMFPPHHHHLPHQIHLFPHNPYAPSPPPPPIAHKVWILDCKSCGSFLTNRGMKAVLLLRPNVSLYSSDALPVNCSAYTSNPDVLRPASPCQPSSSSQPSRTCECLTQTLCCHGCGTSVGYMIVIPCTRCTSSITATNRATNGHRFVFHSSEIVGTERHYIEDEPGVIPYDPYIPFVTSQPPSTSTPMRPGHLPPVSPERSEPSIAYPSPPPSAHESTPSPFRFHSPHASATLENPHTSVPSQFAYAVPPPPFVMPYNHPGHVSIESKDTPPPSRKLNAGDVLFWHHLARHGEIPGVMEDKRARRASSACDDHREDGARVSELGVKLSSRGKKMIFFDR